MLILRRKLQDSIQISNGVTITVVGIKGRQVRFGFNAPREISIQRKEVYLKKLAEKQGETFDPGM